MVTLEDAKNVANTFASEMTPPHAVVVFGSVARYGRGDDLDLLVVTSRETERKEIGLLLAPFRRRFDIDFLVISEDTYLSKVREGAPFLKAIRKQGKLLYMDTFEKWKNLASEDLAQARYLKDGNFHRGACFNAQQSMEKAMKYVLLRKGWEFEITHNIGRLMGLCEEYGISLDMDDEDLGFIDSIHIGMYPLDDGLLPHTFSEKEDAERAIRIAENVFEQIGLA